MLDDLAKTDLDFLRSLLGQTSEEYRVVCRAAMILAYAECGSIRATAARFGCGWKTVQRWVKRWIQRGNLGSLRDLHRSGRTPQFGIRETAKILSFVSQSPSAHGLVMAGWTQQLVVEVLAREGVVMSRSTVQRILTAQDIDVRSVKYWLYTPTDRPEFIERRDAICDLYCGMSTLPSDEIVVCFDPKPGIQVLGNPKNNDGGQGPRSGRFRRIEFEYRRMGTRSLVAAVSPATGEVLHYDLFHKERRFDSAATITFLDELREKLFRQGFRRIHLVLDNGSTHVSKATSAYLAKHADAFTTYFTPVHASWLNLCENFFSILSRRYLKHRRYASIDDFVSTVPLWIADHNRRSNPLRWTYAPHQKAA
jgi:transposase